MSDKVKVFICNNCNYEDSSFIPDFAVEKNGLVFCSNCKKEVPKTIVEQEYGRTLSLIEFVGLLNYLKNNLELIHIDSKSLKKIKLTFDTRTNNFFSVILDYEGKYVSFIKTNENRHRDLLKWIQDEISKNMKKEKITYEQPLKFIKEKDKINILYNSETVPYKFITDSIELLIYVSINHGWSNFYFQGVKVKYIDLYINLEKERIDKVNLRGVTEDFENKIKNKFGLK